MDGKTCSFFIVSLACVACLCYVAPANHPDKPTNQPTNDSICPLLWRSCLRVCRNGEASVVSFFFCYDLLFFLTLWWGLRCPCSLRGCPDGSCLEKQCFIIVFACALYHECVTIFFCLLVLWCVNGWKDVFIFYCVACLCCLLVLCCMMHVEMPALHVFIHPCPRQAEVRFMMNLVSDRFN